MHLFKQLMSSGTVTPGHVYLTEVCVNNATARPAP